MPSTLLFAGRTPLSEKILVFNGCCHDTVDDTFVDLHEDRPEMRSSLLGQIYDLLQYPEVIEFNDLATQEKHSPRVKLLFY